jgi:hypothetical protein
MEILSQEEMTSRVDFARPLHPTPEEPASMWCIPFEWGANSKGTRISIAKAKEIAAELRASIAEAEKRELRRAFDQEKKNGEERDNRYLEYSRKLFDCQQEVLILKRQIKALKKKNRG